MKPTRRKATEEGLTLLESLVGIMVIAIVVTALTPPMLIAFASRVQNYRASQGMKIAQGEIDRVRLLVEKAEYSPSLTNQLPPVDQSTAYNTRALYDVGPPTGPNMGTCPQLNVIAATSTTSWCTVDINGDGDENWDLAVQTFRSKNPPKTEEAVNPGGSGTVDKPVAFFMGVRVYTRAAMEAKKYVSPQQRTASLGLTAGQALSLPLVNRYEPIVRSDLNISRFAYCELNNQLAGYSGCNN